MNRVNSVHNLTQGVYMDLKQFLTHMNAQRPVPAGSEVHRFMIHLSNEAMRITARLNNDYREPQEIRALFSQLTGQAADETFTLFPPFYTDFGKNITVGKNVFINSGCRFQDQGGVFIGDGSLIGHNAVLATLNHALNPAERGTTLPAPVKIGKRVWLGANVTVIPGVTIGDGAVIAAGAVVTRDVPPNAVAAGVPARTVKMILQENTK